MSMTSTDDQEPAAQDAAQGTAHDTSHSTAQAPAAEAAGAAVTEEDHAAGGDAQEDGKGLGAVQLIGSALAAALGVQSSKNRERDFKQGRAGTFILVGLVFTALFIGAVYGVVSLVLSSR